MGSKTTPSAFKRVFIGDDDDYATQVPNEDLLHVAGRHGPIVRASSQPDADTVTIAGRLHHTGAWLSDYQRTPEWHGAVGDGNNHPAGAALGVTTLEELQVLFPFADSLADEMDWLGIQAALYAGGIVKGRPEARYVVNKTLTVPNGRVQADFTHCDLLWEGMAAAPDDGSTLVTDGHFAGDGSAWQNTLLEPARDWTFTGGFAAWVDGPTADPQGHFGQFGQQVHLPQGRWTVEAWIKLSEGASAGYYGPPYCGFAFFADQVGQGGLEWPDPLDKSVTLSPGDDGVSTYLSFDFEVFEEAGRDLWLTFSGGNCDIEVRDVRIKPFLMNYAMWMTGDPLPYASTAFDYDESTWTGGQILGPGPSSPIYTGPAIGGVLHKNFQGDGARCNFVDMIILRWLVGITMSDHAYLQRFDALKIGFCGTCVKYLAGSVNAAENYRFTGGILFNSGLAVDAVGGGEWFFYGTSWDYCRRFLSTDRGAYIATHGLHIEGHQAETYIPVSDWTDFDDGETITGGTSGATALLISDKGDQDWDEGPRLVVQLLTGTFQVGETVTGPSGGSAVVAGAVVRAPYMFDVRGASMWNAASGEVLFAGYTHNGADYIGNVESNMDQIAFGSVWLYNMDTASGVTWNGGGRVTVERHMGPTNPNLARLWLVNHHSDGFGGMGDFTTEGGTAGMTLTDALPADGIPMDMYLRADATRADRLSFAPDGPSVVLDTSVARVTDGASLRLDIPVGYGSGQQCNLRVFVPVRNGKLFLDRYYLHKPDVMPDVTHGPFAGGISLSTLGGRSMVTISDPSADGLAGAGPQPGWTVTLTGVTGNPGGIPNATLNATHVIADMTEDGIIIDVGVNAASDATGAGGAGIGTTYVQKNFLLWDRRMWVKIGWRDPDGIPVILQDQYQGESNYTVDFGNVQWTLGNPERNRWWYTEREVPDDPMERIGDGRAPEWATHMMMDINFWNLLYAGTPPPVYLAGFFANVV